MDNWKRVIKYNLLVANVARLMVKFQYLLGEKQMAIANFGNIAAFCTSNYIGTYRWVSLENNLIRISQKHIPIPAQETYTPGKTKKVLHVLTEGYAVGGHTQFLINWIVADSMRKHSILFTNQQSPVPGKLRELERNFDVPVIELSASKDHLSRSKELRLLSLNYDIVILHHHSHDIIPLLAFAYSGGPSVGIINLSDHIPWIGVAIADLIIQFRETALKIDTERRQFGNAEILPIPITVKQNYCNAAARSELGISESQVMLLTIASEYKFKPVPGYNYFESIIKILENYPNVISYVVGVSKDSDIALNYKHERLIFAGITSQTAKYEAACDIYVESFPFVSLTSLLQTVAGGKACQLIYNPVLLNKCFNNQNFKYPENKAEWQNNLVRLINEKDYRTNIAFHQSSYIVENNVIGDSWKKKLAKCYSQLGSATHHTAILKKSIWVYTSNERLLLDVNSTKISLAGIVSSKNFFFKVFVFGISKILSVYRKTI